MDTPKTKPTKMEALQDAARTSKNITAWMTPRTEEVTEIMNWSDDTDVPTGERISDIERREGARRATGLKSIKYYEDGDLKNEFGIVTENSIGSILAK